MRKHFFSSLFITSLLVFATTCSAKVEVFIINGLPSSMTIRCQSKDDDLGFRELAPSLSPGFNWRFNTVVFGHTLFFCHFWWGQNDTSFDSYNDDKMGWSEVCYNEQEERTTCYWQAREDGIYFNNENTVFPDGWTKKCDWLPKECDYSW